MGALMMRVEEMRNILIVDDNQQVLDGLKEVLSRKFHTTVARDADSAFTLANSLNPDLIILDIDLGSSKDGVDLCQALRNEINTRDIPVLMLTGFSATDAKTRAFSAGADDYMEKPVLPEELLARIDSKLRRWGELQPVAGSTPKPVRCGNLVLSPERNEAVVAGEVFRFSALEFSLLETFVGKPEKIISRDEILKQVWNGVTVGERTIDAHLTNLRKKLKGFDFEIANVYGSGFILRRKSI
jgi:DNA-binding response OmpR family regulator